MDCEIKMTKFLVTGSAGLIGRQIVKDLTSNDVEVYSCYNKTEPKFGIPIHLDLTKEDEIVDTLKKIKPNVIIHLGAITDVELCESQKEMATIVNTKATEILALESEKYNSFFVYLSTDYVFDGKEGLKNENDIPNPINFYGKSKLQGEIALNKISSPHIIIRTSTPFGIHPKKKSFPLWIKENLELKNKIPVLIDQYTSPSYVPNLSKMILEIISKKITGIIHLAEDTRISRFEFAKIIANKFNLDENLLKSSKMNEMNWIAKRPMDSSLDVSKAKKILDNKPKKIEYSLEFFIKEF